MTAELADATTREDWGPRVAPRHMARTGPSTAKGLSMAGLDYLRAIAGGQLPRRRSRG